MSVAMAGKLMPYLAQIGALKLPTLLRLGGAVGGGAPALLRGDLVGAVTGAGLGALGTAGLGGAASGLAGKAGLKAAQLAGGQGARATAAGILGRAAVPLAGGLALGKLGSGVGGAVGRGAVGLGGYALTGGEGMGGAALPPGVGPYGTVAPTGSPLDVINPLGLEAGRRTRTVKDAQALRDAQNIVLPTVRKFAEQAKKDEFERSLAAEGIKSNITMNRNLTEGLAQATRQMGTTAAEQAGSALTSRFNY
tara:strand:+ start:193 stop:945 length:753 start_codon:yes stop_codon:yes gene_type:complete